MGPCGKYRRVSMECLVRRCCTSAARAASRLYRGPTPGAHRPLQSGSTAARHRLHSPAQRPRTGTIRTPPRCARPARPNDLGHLSHSLLPRSGDSRWSITIGDTMLRPRTPQPPITDLSIAPGHATPGETHRFTDCADEQTPEDHSASHLDTQACAMTAHVHRARGTHFTSVQLDGHHHRA